MKQPPTTAQVQSSLKRINDRLFQLEKQGLKESESYKSYVELSLKLGGQGIKYSQSGRPSLDIPRVNKMTEEQQKLAAKWGSKNSKRTAGEEIKRAKEEYKLRYGQDKDPTKKELQKIIKQNSEVHNFIEENSNQIYQVSYLTKAVRQPRRLTYQERDDLLDMYNNPNYRDKNGQFVGDNGNTDANAKEVQ